MNLSFQKSFYVIATTVALFAIMVLAKPILIPISVALLISFILLPLARKYEAWKINRIVAAFLSILSIILIIAGILYFFSTQLINISNEFGDFKNKIISAFAEITVYINNNVSFVEDLKKDEILTRTKELLSNSTGSLIKKTVSNTAAFFAGLMATFVFIFLFLIYRDGLTHAFLGFSHKDNRNRVFKMFKSVQQVGQKYLIGMVILTIIIGSANSIGLLIIGIDNPFLFGFLGAALAIIPYIGAAMGALIPAIYAFVSYDASWMPLAVIILFYFIQLVTDNFLAPKIVGSSLKLNALTVILSLFIGASVWGIAGMILFLPFAAIIRVVCQEFDALKPVAQIMGEHNIKTSDSNGIASVWWNKIKKRLTK